MPLIPKVDPPLSANPEIQPSNKRPRISFPMPAKYDNPPIPRLDRHQKEIDQLHTVQLQQSSRLASLERENTKLKAAVEALTADFDELSSRLEAIEVAKNALEQRRQHCVEQLRNSQFHHQAAANTFMVQVQDVGPADVEAMLSIYGNTITMLINHQQHQMLSMYRNQMHSRGPADIPFVHLQPVRYAYPATYSQNGFCLAHGGAYICSTCGP